MITLHFATEGVLGKSQYVPINQKTVTLDGNWEQLRKPFDEPEDPWNRVVKEEIAKYAALVKLKNPQWRYEDDHKITAQAQAWGYDEAWINQDGYVVFVGRNPPNDRPDPVRAYWIPEKERQKMLRDRMPYPNATDEKVLDACVLLMVDDGLVLREALDLVTLVYGKTRETLNEVMRALTGERDVVEHYADKLKICGLIKEETNEETEPESETEETGEEDEAGESR